MINAIGTIWIWRLRITSSCSYLWNSWNSLKRSSKVRRTGGRTGGNGKLNMPEFISSSCLWMYKSWCWSSMESWSSWSKWQSSIGDLQTGHWLILAPASRLQQGSQKTCWHGWRLVGRWNKSKHMGHLLSSSIMGARSGSILIFDGCNYTDVILSKKNWF